MSTDDPGSADSNTMTVFVTGVNGQLGHDVMNELAGRGIRAVGSDITEAYGGVQDASPVAELPYRQLDITDQQAVHAVLEEIQPDAVIHCAAWTAVDAAEEPENLEKVREINVAGTEYIAETCDDLGAKMLYLSTDYVFNGQGEEPWDPDYPDFEPLNVYGQSKLDGELAVIGNLDNHFIVRIAWVFGKSGNNFIKTMLKLGRTKDELRVVCDQIGTPTYTYDLAKLLADMIQTEEYGYYHATNEGGYISWYDFAVEIFRQAGISIAVHPVTTEEYGVSKAARPFNSRLDKKKLTEKGFTPLPDWKDALHRYLIEIGEINA